MRQPTTNETYRQFGRRVAANWAVLGVGVGANQAAGFVLLWGAVFVLGYLNAKAPAPDSSAQAVGAG